MILVDVHAHLDHEEFIPDLDQVIERAKQAGVKAIITNGVDPQTNRQTLKIAERYDIVEPALGIYPVDALRSHPCTEKEPLFDFDKELKFIESQCKRIVAIGEIGLDFKNSTKKEEQILDFQRLINLAEKCDKPIIVHSRSAEKEVLQTLESCKIRRVVLHCFSGKLKLVKSAIDRGYYFSIPPNIVRSQHFQELVRVAPISHILTETDAPYLSPIKATRNEPCYVAKAIGMVAQIKKIEPEEVANNVYMNFQRLFNTE